MDKNHGNDEAGDQVLYGMCCSYQGREHAGCPSPELQPPSHKVPTFMTAAPAGAMTGWVDAAPRFSGRTPEKNVPDMWGTLPVARLRAFWNRQPDRRFDDEHQRKWP